MSSTKRERMPGGSGMAGREVVVVIGMPPPVVAMSRPSTSSLPMNCKDVDARHKAGHDEINLQHGRARFSQMYRNCARSRFASLGTACPTMISLKCRVCW